MNRRKKGPTFTGAVLLLLAIVLILKFAYSARPEEAVLQDPYEAEESLYDRILNELTAYSTEIIFDYDCTEQLFDTFERVLDEHPELFWLTGNGEYEKKTSAEETKVTFTVETELNLIEILRCKSELEHAKNSILSEIDENTTDYEKLMYIHDILVKNTEYDSECADAVSAGKSCSGLWQSSSAYGCLVKNLAICSGYSAAFQLLCNEAGFDCMRVSGRELESGVAHEWNCVKLGESWYYVDTTWDDPLYRNEDSYFSGSVTHEYFMITEDRLLATHSIAENEAVPICDDESGNYYRRSGYYLDEYSFDETAAVIMRQLDREIIEIFYSSTAESEKAVSDLFDGQMFYEIDGIRELGTTSVTYNLGSTGLLRIAALDTAPQS